MGHNDGLIIAFGQMGGGEVTHCYFDISPACPEQCAHDVEFYNINSFKIYLIEFFFSRLRCKFACDVIDSETPAIFTVASEHPEIIYTL